MNSQIADWPDIFALAWSYRKGTVETMNVGTKEIDLKLTPVTQIGTENLFFIQWGWG